MHGALAFLTVCSIRNAVSVRLRRLRQPRYLIVAIGLLVYLASMILSRWQSGGLRVPPQYEGAAEVATGAIVAVMMAASWILPASPSLRFSLADVHFLFPAPVTRRDLLGFKIVRLLVAAAGTGILLALLLGPLRPGAALAFWLKTTLILSVLALHEAGVSLYRQNRKDRGALGGRRAFPVMAAALALIAFGSIVVARFAFAAVPGEFLLLLPVVVIAIAAQAVWVLRSDAAFEEQAAVQAERTRAQAPLDAPRPGLATQPKPARFALAPRGPVETAILWKNWLSFSRGSGAQWIGPASILLLLAVGFLTGFGKARGDSAAPFLAFVLAAMVVLMGPIMFRIDLRQDLTNLPLIKTWPVSGAAIVRGEVLAPAIVLSAAVFGLVLIGGIFAPEWLLPPSLAGGRLALIVGATAVGSALIVAQLVIQNAIAALFPAWVRIAPASSGGGGIDGIGQSLVMMYGGLLALVGAAILPGAVAGLIAFAADGLVLAAVVFAVMLFAECYAATEVVGRILDRTDLQDVIVVAT